VPKLLFLATEVDEDLEAEEVVVPKEGDQDLMITKVETISSEQEKVPTQFRSEIAETEITKRTRETIKMAEDLIDQIDLTDQDR